MKHWNPFRVARLIAAFLPSVPAFTPDVSGQERLQIDSSEGRLIAGGIQYEFVTFGGSAIDYDLGLLYVVESADPFRVQALSLSDGTVRGVFGAGEGDGPGELRAVVSVAAVEGDGVVMADHGRIVRWNAEGDLLYTWSPAVPGVPNVCALRGRPVIAVLGGVAFRTPEGATRTVPFQLPSPEALFPTNDRERAEEMAMELITSEIACSGDTAYVQTGNQVMAYSLTGDVFELQIPDVFSEDARRSRGTPRRPGVYLSWYHGMSIEDGGQVVLTTLSLDPHAFAAAAIDPGTGCYRLILDEDDASHSRQLMAIYRDSALVAHRGRIERELDGRSVMATSSQLSSIWLHPFRRTGPEAHCPEGPTPRKDNG